MNKFRTLLKETGSKVKAARAALLVESAKFEAEKQVRDAEDKLRKLKMRENEMTDFYPESEFSLRVTKQNFDADKWFSELCDLRVEIANTEIEVEIAKNAFNEWFGDSNETGSDEESISE